MPWMLLEKGPLPARRTVLLDYISPNIISALIKSVKAKDFVEQLTLLEKVNITTGVGWMSERCVGKCVFRDFFGAGILGPASSV